MALIAFSKCLVYILRFVWGVGNLGGLCFAFFAFLGKHYFAKINNSQMCITCTDMNDKLFVLVKVENEIK